MIKKLIELWGVVEQSSAMNKDTLLLPPLSKDGSLHVTDEKYNTIISSIGAVLGLIGFFALVQPSVSAHKFWHIWSFSIYGLSLVILFLASALHHGIDGSPKTEKRLLQFDYCAIYLMIAGTVTPLCLIVLRNSLGWSVLSLMWILAVVGVVLKLAIPHLPKWITTITYLGMGWLGLVIAPPLLALPEGSHILSMIGLGGFFFTFGAVIFHFEKPNPVPGKFGFHEIWHIFVLLGAASHFAAMYLFVLPMN